MRITIDILTPEGTGIAYIVRDVRITPRQLEDIMGTKASGRSRFTLRSGTQTLSIPLAEVSGINVKFDVSH